MLHNLQHTLCFVHKHEMVQPVEGTMPSKCVLSPAFTWNALLTFSFRYLAFHQNEYLTTVLLRPIVDIFNYLHSPRVLEMPLECIEVDPRGCGGFTLSLHRFGSSIVLFLHHETDVRI